MTKGSYSECPDCGQRVLSANLRAHRRKVHQAGSTRPSRPTKKVPVRGKPNAGLYALVAFVVLALIGGSYYALVLSTPRTQNTNSGNPVITMDVTGFGTITVELYADSAPLTVGRFLEHVRASHFDGTQFHRVVRGFVIQGGEMTPAAAELNWENTGLKNLKYTLSMARRGDSINSATSQFFINLIDNPTLDTPQKQAGDGCQLAYCPYAVFGAVTDGMSVVDTIGQVPTTTGPKCPSGESCQPVTPIYVASMREI
jgi:cyclophilin family peptidyl-prolyl cis-trans isomerase